MSWLPYVSMLKMLVIGQVQVRMRIGAMTSLLLKANAHRAICGAAAVPLAPVAPDRAIVQCTHAAGAVVLNCGRHSAQLRAARGWSYRSSGPCGKVEKILLCRWNRAARWNVPVVSAEVPNLSFTMYPFSIATDEYVPLQHFTRWGCTSSAFRQMNMYPYNFFWQNILSWLFTDIFNNEHKMIFENNICWYMYKYLEINNI